MNVVRELNEEIQSRERSHKESAGRVPEVCNRRTLWMICQVGLLGQTGNAYAESSKELEQIDSRDSHL